MEVDGRVMGGVEVGRGGAAAARRAAGLDAAVGDPSPSPSPSPNPSPSPKPNPNQGDEYAEGGEVPDSRRLLAEEEEP